uniref:Uncharacterized protein n=1 Tax=viral metagenome TaxID=1070528 RepID=A0A6C0DGD7_9ZZZZ
MHVIYNFIKYNIYIILLLKYFNKGYKYLLRINEICHNMFIN